MQRYMVALLVVALGSVAPAATLTVDFNGGADYTDIQSAIDAAADGDTVLVMPGEYVITEPIDFNRLHDTEDPESPPVKNLVLRSAAGAEVTTIRMSEEPANPDRASVVIFESGEIANSVLEGFTLKETPQAPHPSPRTLRRPGHRRPMAQNLGNTLSILASPTASFPFLLLPRL